MTRKTGHYDKTLTNSLTFLGNKFTHFLFKISYFFLVYPLPTSNYPSRFSQKKTRAWAWIKMQEKELPFLQQMESMVRFCYLPKPIRASGNNQHRHRPSKHAQDSCKVEKSSNPAASQLAFTILGVQTHFIFSLASFNPQNSLGIPKVVWVTELAWHASSKSWRVNHLTIRTIICKSSSFWLLRDPQRVQ